MILDSDLLFWGHPVECLYCAASTSAGSGVLPRPSSASIDRHSLPDWLRFLGFDLGLPKSARVSTEEKLGTGCVVFVVPRCC